MISTNYGKTKALLLLIMALLVSSLSLRAEKPLKPLYFLVDYSAYDKLMICETSLDGDYENVDGFRVYINYPWQSDPSFSLLADVVRNDSLMKHFESFYAFMIWNDLKQGDYKLLLTAYNSDGESVPSDTFYLKVGNPDEPSDYVVIYSDSLNPADYTAYLGVEYKSKLSAYAESGREVNFRTEYAPEGFQIDPVTGEFNWTPTESGDFDINIRAFVKEEPEIYADWWWRVHVNKCSEKTIIKGKVIDKETGAPIEYGFVTLMQSGKDSIDFYYGKYWGEIINGEFSIEVDEGTFYIMAQGDFEPVWYENAKDYSEATPITLKCGETAEIKFIVEKFKTYPIHTVTGKVTDKDGNPFKYAYVEFYSVDDGGFYGVVNSTSVDETGYYKIELSSQFKYIARAYGFNREPMDTIFDPYEFTPLYYNQVTNPNDATVLVMDKDYNDINFVFGEEREFENSLTGYLKNEEGEIIRDGFIVAYLVGSGLDYIHDLYFGKFAQVDINGKFELQNLIPGEYVILGMPMNALYMPGFYVEGNTATWLWEEATRVTVKENGNSGDYDVVLPLMMKIDGIKGIRGTVVAETGAVIKSDDSPMGQQPVNGALVYAVDKNNVKVKYDVTDQEGRFELKGLKDGSYKLYVDKVGYKYSWENVTVDQGEQYGEKNLVLIGQQTDVKDDNRDVNLVKSFPNPASDIVSFNTPLISGKVNMKVYDSKGNVVMQSSNNYNGVSLLRLDVSSLSNGLYLVNIQNGASTYTAPVIIAR